MTVTRHIVGYKKEESDALLKFLYDHIAFGGDFQVRVKWENGTVVVWDVSLPMSISLPLSESKFDSNSYRIV